MPHPGPVKLRTLPEGEFLAAQETGWEGNLLQLTLLEEPTRFSTGVLAEIESDSALYFGEVRQCNGKIMKVLVEHSLDRARLATVQENWG